MNLEQLLEEAEPVDGGVTNDVWSTDNEIIKKYSGRPRLGSVLELYRRAKGEPQDLSPASRVENEKFAEEYFSDKEFSTPEIIDHQEVDGDHYVIFENLEGDSYGEAVGNLGWEETRQIARKVGESLSELHEDDCARRDSRGENVIYTKQKGEFDLHWIDNEYFTDDASDFEKYVDINTFLSEADTYHPNKQYWVRKGFSEGYDWEPNGWDTLLAFPLAATLIWEDFGKGRATYLAENVIRQTEDY